MAARTALRDEIADLFERIDPTDAGAVELPHRAKYLLMVNGFLHRRLDLHLELVDEIERELRAGRAARSRP